MCIFSAGVDAELVALMREKAHQFAHHAELLAMNHDLSRKLLAEKEEIKRLRDEIQEMQTLYGYRWCVCGREMQVGVEVRSGVLESEWKGRGWCANG